MKLSYTATFVFLLALVFQARPVSAEDVMLNEDEHFEQPFRLESGGQLINVNTGHAAPYLIDFDGDGKRDLLVGEYGSGMMEFEGKPYARGRLRIYRNVGTEQEPKYDGFEWFKAGGEIAQVPIACCVGFTPELVDWDADGDLDILTGSYPGHLYLYRNNGDGTYAKAQTIVDVDGNPIKPDDSTNLRAYDWDKDGDLDLVIATSGTVYLVKNVGNAKRPAFESEPQRIKYRNHPIAMRGRLGVELTDWNADGHIDLLIGRSAGVNVLYGSDKDGELVFERSEVLVSAHLYEELGSRLKTHVADYNGDGLDDLLVGDIYWPKQIKLREGLTDEQVKEYEAFIERTQPATDEIYRLMIERDLYFDRRSKPNPQTRIWDLLDERGRDYFTIKKQYEQTIDLGDHGHVWVFLRKKSDPLADARADFEPYPASGTDNIQLRMGPASKTIAPGQTFRVGLHFEVAEGIQTYSGVEGLAGAPTKLDVHLPDGFTLSEQVWPASGIGEDQSEERTAKAKGALSKDFVVTLVLKASEELTQDEYKIRLTANWQECRDQLCIPGEAYSSVSLNVGEPKPTPIAKWVAPIHSGDK